MWHRPCYLGEHYPSPWSTCCEGVVVSEMRRTSLLIEKRANGRPAEPPKNLLINAAPATGFAAQESGSTPMKERIVNVSGILMRMRITTRESIIIIKPFNMIFTQRFSFIGCYVHLKRKFKIRLKARKPKDYFNY